MIHIKSLVKLSKEENENDYPNKLPVISNLDELDLNNEVIIFVGENGSGKTTIMEILASLLNLHRINYPSLPTVDKLNKIKKTSSNFKVQYKLNKKTGFYFQGEDFINYINYLNTTLFEAEEEIKKIDEEYKNRSDYARSQAKVPFLKTINEINSLYDVDLIKSSHGEGFIHFFNSRIKANQIYLLDEPETPLSFNNQLVMISIIKEAINQNSQFIISTHSPILMSIPNAKIYVIENDKIIEKNYDDLEQVNNIRDFLNNKDVYLRYL